MVQSVLGAKNLEQGQLGVNFIGWLKDIVLATCLLLPEFYVMCFSRFERSELKPI